jgi:hypothetical protein
MFTAPGPFPRTLSLVLKFVDLGGPRAGAVLAELPVRFEMDRQVQKKSFSFGPLSGTVGHSVAMEIRGGPDQREPFALLWNRPEPGTPAEEDFYPGGNVFFDGKPARGDLYFITF